MSKTGAYNTKSGFVRNGRCCNYGSSNGRFVSGEIPQSKQRKLSSTKCGCDSRLSLSSAGLILTKHTCKRLYADQESWKSSEGFKTGVDARVHQERTREEPPCPESYI